MKKRIAVIHDWLIGMRGGEYVLETILQLYPSADVFTLFYNKDRISDLINSHRIFTSSLNNWSFIKRNYKYFLHKFPIEIEKFNLQDYDLIISSSHCVAKGIIPRPDSIHFSYLHTPMRYIWDQYYNYFEKSGYLKKKIIDKKLNYLRMWDVTSSSRVDYFIANSSYVSKRINKFYKRESEIIFPPIEVDFFTPDTRNREDFYICVNALVPYKRTDIIVNAFNKSGKELIVIGKGSEYKKLKRLSKPNIKFINNLNRNELREFYRRAKALVYAGIEDFGMSFVEAQATGLPVIAYNKGGVCDIVNHKKTGILYDNQDIDSLNNAIEEFESLKFYEDDLRENSLRFSKDKFLEKFKRFVDERVK